MHQVRESARLTPAQKRERLDQLMHERNELTKRVMQEFESEKNDASTE